MALVKQVLNVALTEAFKQAMIEFITITKTSNAADVSNIAIAAAAAKFAALASTAIDGYIRTATIVIPPGQAVTTVPLVGTGSTVSPSLPAAIS